MRRRILRVLLLGEAEACDSRAMLERAVTGVVELRERNESDMVGRSERERIRGISALSSLPRS